jgi:hypothetical protein
MVKYTLDPCHVMCSISDHGDHLSVEVHCRPHEWRVQWLQKQGYAPFSDRDSTHMSFQLERMHTAIVKRYMESVRIAHNMVDEFFRELLEENQAAYAAPGWDGDLLLGGYENGISINLLLESVPHDVNDSPTWPAHP